MNDILYPDGIKCIVCDGELNKTTKYGLCDECSLAYNTHYCQRCGRKKGEDLALYCNECMNSTYYFEKARAPFVYQDDVKKLVYKLKYGSGKYLAKYFAQFMYDTYVDADFDIDTVTYVPMPKERQSERGYNQAKEVAIHLSKLLDKPIEDLLARSHYTSNLARMNKKERAEAIKDSFLLIGNAKNKNILLVDDVFTSGATANECSRILKKGKANAVYVLTFATSKESPVLI